jgi:hypothetical protein
MLLIVHLAKRILLNTLITFNVHERAYVHVHIRTDIYGHARLFTSMPLPPKLR